MKKVNGINISGNRITDLSMLENSELLENSNQYFSQNIIYDDIFIEEGKILEIEVPEIINELYNPNSSFYTANAYVENYNEFDDEYKTIRLNENKSKIIIDTTNMPIGERNETLYIKGDGRLSDTVIWVKYRVIRSADKTNEVEFESKRLKDYILENHDVDGDGKITAYDMAQIITLNISNEYDWETEDKVSLKGLEYCTSLKELIINRETMRHSAISNLQDLEKIEIRNIDSEEEYNAIINIPNLKKLEIYGVDFSRYNLYDLQEGLEELNIIFGKLPSIYNIGRFSNLQKLDITGIWNDENEVIQGLENINNLPNLKTLSLQSNQLTNLDFIRNNHTITELDLGNNEITDIEFLRDNQTIEELSLYYNHVVDISIIPTMTSLKIINLTGNHITDLSVLEQSELLENVWGFSQSFTFDNIVVKVGDTFEIEVPETIKSAFNPNSKFYITDVYTENFNNLYDEYTTIKLSEDKTKIIIDASNVPIGEREETLYIKGNGRLSDTKVTVSFRVDESADDVDEIEFANNDLKNYILENHDIDGDGKITAYDMAQIIYLTIPSYNSSYEEMLNLKGLEYCISLKELSIYRKSVNYNAISNLQNLELLEISHIENQEEYNAITRITNLKSIKLGNIDFEKYNLYDLPKSLQKLTLSACKIYDISNIESFSNLEYLEIYGNNGSAYDDALKMKLQGLEHINNLTKLKSLKLNLIDLENVNFLKNNRKIKNLNLSFNKITNIDGLTNNNIIECLDLSGNKLANISVIPTITRLNDLNLSGNSITDISVLEGTSLVENLEIYNQKIIKENIIVTKGKILEMEVPKIIQTAFDSSSDFYIQDAEVINEDGNELKLNTNRNKIVIDATNTKVGNKIQTIRISGDGKLSGTNIQVKFSIREEADNVKEISFGNQKLKEYILNNYDIDNDKKITAYDMAQITQLKIDYDINLTNLRGLEYSKNLEELSLYLGNEIDNIDIAPITKLPNLNDLKLLGNTKNIAGIANLKNLERLEVNLTYEENGNDLKYLSGLTNLKYLKLYNGNITGLEALSNLTKLESLYISSSIQEINDINALRNLVNLKEIELYKFNNYDGMINNVDYSALANLTLLETINITDKNSTIDANSIKNLSNLRSLILQVNKVKNSEAIRNNTKLNNISLKQCKITNAGFISNLNNLYHIQLEDNFITDMTPFEGTSAYYINLSGNPINQDEEPNARIIQELRNNGKNLILTEYSKLQNIEFKYPEFKEKLLKSYDINGDNELCQYEMEKISYLDVSGKFENAEYLTNINSISFSELQLSKDEQLELIKEINKIRKEAKVTIYNIRIDLGKMNQNSQKYEININDICPIITEMQNKNSKIYIKDLVFEDYSEFEEQTGKIENGKLILDRGEVGNQRYYVSIHSSTEIGTYTNFNVEWRNVTKGDTTKEIIIEDAKLKEVILEEHDIDGDGRITENDILNISELDISERGISSLKGLEKAKNLKELYAYSNNIKDISPLINLPKLQYAGLERNKITDITCIKNSILTKPVQIYVGDNYIDFSEGSKNLEALKNNYAKDKKGGYEFIINYIVSSQRYGRPEDEQKVVNMDAKLKNKLISYGLDTNGDGNLTRLELYEAQDLESVQNGVNLSGLGLTSTNGLEYLRVYDINLSNNNLIDISVFKKNRFFDSVNLSHNKIKDISSFAYYNSFSIGKVDFSYNEIEDISSIKTWPYLCNDMVFDEGGGAIGRELEIDLSNNNISNITAVKDFRYIKKLNLSNNKISNIEPLASYNFACYTNQDGTKEECLDEFDGIILDGNLINKDTAGNKKAINVFSSKKVKLQIGKQSTEVFEDVRKDMWYYDSVSYVYSQGIMLGTTDTTFKPNDKITRAMLATIIWRMEGSPQATGGKEFSDVKKGQYYYTAIKWAASKGIVNGYDNGKFGPSNYITREQLAVMLNNYARYKKKNVSNIADISKYVDSKSVSPYAKTGVQWAIQNKIISGKDNGTRIDPKGNASRAEVAAMICNYKKNVK